MSYTNATVDLVLDGLWGRILGPAPVQLLNRELNRGLGEGQEDGRRAEHLLPLVFRPQTRRFLTGALPRVKHVLRRAGYRYRIRDPRLPVRPQRRMAVSGPPLRDYQEAVVRAALRRERGLVDVGTGGGKTRIAAEVIARFGLPALYLVTTRTLMRQAMEELSQLLGEPAGALGAGMHREAPVTVALVQSLINPEVDLTPWAGGTLVFDEGHHGCAPRYLDAVTRLGPRAALFLSAVPFRSGRDQHVLDALTGGSLTGRAYAARYLIERGYCAPVTVEVHRVRMEGDMVEKPFWRLYREFLVEHAERNALVARCAREAVSQGASTLVLVDQVRHGEILAAALGDAAAFAHGGLSRTVLAELTQRFAERRIPVLVATAALFSEGISIRGIECLIHAGGLKSKVKVLQAVGRGMRLAPGKKCVRYVDFWDDDALGVFRAHSRKRLSVLREEGFEVPRMERSTVRRDERPVADAWTHVAGTKEFLRVAADGRVTGRGRCLRKGPVPERFCKRCGDPTICERGGEVRWSEGKR